MTNNIPEYEKAMQRLRVMYEDYNGQDHSLYGEMMAIYLLYLISYNRYIT